MTGISVISKKKLIMKVRVVKYQMYRDGGTTEYRDVHNRIYVVPLAQFNDDSVYSDHPCHISKSDVYRDDIRLKDIELEIVESFSNEENNLRNIVVLSEYQINELESYFKNNDFNPIQKIGVVIETGEVVLEYEHVGPYPLLSMGMQTVGITKNNPLK